MVTLSNKFLAGPSLNIYKRVIEFSKTALPEYHGFYAVILDNVLSKEECETLVSAAEQTTSGQWEPALLNVGQGRQRLATDVRQCGRIIWDSHDTVGKIWARVGDHVPELGALSQQPNVTGTGPAKRKETWQMTRLNERMRFLKYTSGDYFKPHCDGCYETPDGQERSYYTLHLYLNDKDSNPMGEELVGGATTFFSMNMQRRLDVEPRTGRVLIFQHRNLLHSGDDVLGGLKLTLRTDIMFKRKKDAAEGLS
ncbi:MAG: hypothetical protein M1821_009230 [Bathelium mastoideum]|nr:MAG: hypothetical protein M1821_009230 [Bathelium mastoideum]